MNRKFLALLCCMLPASWVQAVESFLVRDIRVEGLQRISAGTVFNYLPVKVGDTINEKLSQEAIHALYKTGFFKDVRLERDGNVLVVQVTERPSIASIHITGTRELSEDDLKKSLKEIGLAEGRVYNKSLLDRVEQELRTQYFSRGYYAVIVRPTVTPLERNRVDLQIDINEGKTARIRDINIVGNTVFRDKELLQLFELGPASWWAIFSSRDKYSKQKLSGDLERLRNFYQDQGYLEFNIDSTQVTITPDKESIYVTVNVAEGKRYSITGFKLAGKFPLPEQELNALVTLRPGQVFSRKAVTESSKAITDRLANDGYAFANVNAIPDLNKDKAEASFTFFVDPGKRVYVRRINFSGNIATRDEVLRREMRQLEAAWYSAGKIQRSRDRLTRLGFFEDVNIETPAVAGSADQVDMNVAVKERSTGNLMLGVGFSSSDGLLLRASVSESNLFGTGQQLSVTADNTSASKNYSVNFVDPYYTPDGVSRALSIYYSTLDASQYDTAAYNSKSVGAGVLFGIPLSEDYRLKVGADVERLRIDVQSSTALIAQNFVAAHGPDNTLYKGTLGWSYDTLDSPIIPTVGSLQSVNAEIAVPGSDVQYYKLTYLAGRYWALSDAASFKLKGEFDYGAGYAGTGELPFYKNFFAGGATSVRGYRSRSLGPLDGVSNAPTGGNRRVLLNSELLFPVPGTSKLDKSMRLSLFVDGGMVYGPAQSLDLGGLRYGAGLAFNWYSPIGPISFSLAQPLNAKPGDQTEAFQFTLGVPIR